jgi:two-component system sensor histidine kinase RegB
LTGEISFSAVSRSERLLAVWLLLLPAVPLLVQLTGQWNAETLTLTIDDDGPGFDPTIKGRLGQPYVSKRQRPKQVDELAGGLGLGVFIATTLIERTGGKVSFERSPQGGARIRLVWPRKNAELFT